MNLSNELCYIFISSEFLLMFKWELKITLEWWRSFWYKKTWRKKGNLFSFDRRAQSMIYRWVLKRHFHSHFVHGLKEGRRIGCFLSEMRRKRRKILELLPIRWAHSSSSTNAPPRPWGNLFLPPSSLSPIIHVGFDRLPFSLLLLLSFLCEKHSFFFVYFHV